MKFVAHQLPLVNDMTFVSPVFHGSGDREVIGVSGTLSDCVEELRYANGAANPITLLLEVEI